MDHTAAVGAVRRHFDREWSLRDTGATQRVSLEVHRRFLRRFVPRGAHVLEVGTGGGRFTTELAARGCRVVVTDSAPARLAAHERRVRPGPAERSVLRRELLDPADTSRYADGAFDAVLAYGGALSSGAGGVADVLRGLLRIVGPHGVVVGSVTSLLGWWRHDLPSAAPPGAVPPGAVPPGAVPPDGHSCRRYRWSEVVAFVDAAGGVVLDGSASNWASLGEPDALARIEADRERWQHFVEHEVAACAEPGARDGGTHILFAASPR